MFIITNKATGETIIFPTPEGGQTDIDALPCSVLTKDEINEYLMFHKKLKKKIKK